MLTYQVQLDGSEIGAVTCKKDGLYYVLSCRCEIYDEQIYKLVAICGNQRIALGTLVPDNGRFMLNTRIPIKSFPVKEVAFLAVPQREQGTQDYIKLRESKPIPTLEWLIDAHFGYRGLEPVIYFNGDFTSGQALRYKNPDK